MKMEPRRSPMIERIQQTRLEIPGEKDDRALLTAVVLFVLATAIVVSLWWWCT